MAAKLAKALSDREGGLVFDAGNLTLGDYLDRWLNDSVKDSVKQRTFENYTYLVRKHLAPELGRIKLKTLTPAHVQGLYRAKLDSGLSTSIVRLMHNALHKALKQAVRWSLVPRNVAEIVQAPRPKKKEIRPLAPDQARTLLEAARGNRLEALYVLAVTAGLRRGELLGLRWQDVDLERGSLQVRQQLTRTKDGLSFTSPKGGKSRSVRLTLAVAIMAMLMVSMLSAGPAFASGPATDEQCPGEVVDPEGRSDICHRTGSDTNPYIFLENIPNNAFGHFGVHVNEPLDPGGCETCPRTDIVP